MLAGIANLDNEPAVDRLCEHHATGKHRFQIELPRQILNTYQGRALYVHGIRVVDGVENAALAGSGTILFPKPSVNRSVPDTYPPLSGIYESSAQHPRVFTTQSDLDDLAKRINSPGSFSARSFNRLTDQIKNDLAAKVDWDASYNGCDIEMYLHTFSIEPRGGYAAEIRTEDQIRAALHVQSGTASPAGAAVVASRLALYATLEKASAATPSNAPSVDQAITLAKRILLAWADHGFRDERGNFRQFKKQFCDVNGKPAVVVALQISRGVEYSVYAQDLLQSLHVFTPQEEMQLNLFHGAMYKLIRNASNEEFDSTMASRNSDETYNNQFANHVVGLLALARLFDDRARFNAALFGGDAAQRVNLPWVKLFNYVVYGIADTPLLRVTPNSSDDPVKSTPAYSTTVVAPGEINDRFRNWGPLQGMGYPVFTLEHLFSAAEILRNAGLDAYSYRGTHQQSIEMATQYYACYGKFAGFKKVITPENALACPNHEQYIGKIVNDVETVILLGSYRFPENTAITGLDAAAKTEAARDPLDAIRFGLWRD